MGINGRMIILKIGFNIRLGPFSEILAITYDRLIIIIKNRLIMKVEVIN